jgi:hypothetical protein
VWGRVLSIFGKKYACDRSEIKRIFAFQTLGIVLDDVVKRLQFKQPNDIKLDLTGIEHLIFNDGQEILKQLEGILIKVSDVFLEQAAECQKLFTEARLVLKEKRDSEAFDIPDFLGRGAVRKQIWDREHAA